MSIHDLRLHLISICGSNHQWHPLILLDGTLLPLLLVPDTKNTNVYDATYLAAAIVSGRLPATVLAVPVIYVLSA